VEQYSSDPSLRSAYTTSNSGALGESNGFETWAQPRGQGMLGPGSVGAEGESGKERREGKEGEEEGGRVRVESM